MKNVIIISFLLLAIKSYGQFELKPNTKRFQVNEYYTIGNSGKYELYKTHGFSESTPSGTSGKIFIMPIIEIDENNIKYYNSNGNIISSSGDVFSITIPISIKSQLPREQEIPAIANALENGTSVLRYFRPIAKNDFGQLVVHPNAMFLFSQIQAQATEYEKRTNQQTAIIQKYKDYKPELISLSELEIKLEVDDELIYYKSFYGTYISTSNKVSFKVPSNYVKNKIASGDYSIYVSYKFRDIKSGYVDATFDARAVMNQFLDEAQQSMVSQSSSGWSFLGFGSRRKSIKSSFNHTVKTSYTGSTHSSTNIEMFDADDKMIAQFEEAFFPTLSKAQAIENHLKAAEVAKQQGNTNLQKIHEDYVKSLQNNDPNLEVDIAKAAAALSKKDYVGFIAHGVRWGDVRATGNSEFRRVIVDDYEFEQHKDWTMSKKVSVQHSITERINSTRTISYRGAIGIVEGIPYQFNGVLSGYTYPTLIKGVILGPIIAGSALHKKNVISGTFVTSINGKSTYDGQTFLDAIKYIEPEDKIIVRYIESDGMGRYLEKSVTITADYIPDFND